MVVVSLAFGMKKILTRNKGLLQIRLSVKRNKRLGGGNSNIFYFHPYLGFHDPI